MKKGLSVLLVLCSMFSAQLFAQGKAETADESGKAKIAVVLKTLSSEYWKRVEVGCDEAAEKYGYELIKLGPPTEDAIEQQINMVQDALTAHPAALVFSPSQPPTAVNVLNKAKDMGIPIVLVDTPMEKSFTNYDSFVGTANYDAGVAGAKNLIKAMSGKHARVVIIEGAPGNPTCTLRADGAEATFKAEGYEIISRQPGYSDREKAFTVMQNAIQVSTDIDIVFCANDEMALGAERAISQAGIKARIMGVDGNKSALESIIADGLYATIAQRPEKMGYLAVENAVKVINGETVDKYIDAGVDIITKADAQNALDNLNK